MVFKTRFLAWFSRNNRGRIRWFRGMQRRFQFGFLDRNAYDRIVMYTYILDVAELTLTVGVSIFTSNKPVTQMHETLNQNPKSEALEVGKAPFQVIKGIREAILDETFKPGDRLLESDLGERFKVSRSPVREALFALENEGTAVMVPYKGAIVKPLSPQEVLDIGELRLAVIALVAKPAHHCLSPADFELLYGLAKQITAANAAREHFKYDRRFWAILFEKAHRPVLWEMFTRLDDRMTRYYPLYQKLFPTPESRPCQREVLLEFYRNGKIAEAVGAFSKLYREVVDEFIDYLNTGDG